MKFFKRLFFFFLFIGIFTLVFKSWLYRNLITYKTIGERRNYSITNPSLENYINDNSMAGQTDVKKIIKNSLKITSNSLCYSFEKNQNDPNRSFKTKTAHCVGYAAYQASVCNYLFSKSKLRDWSARPLAGQLYLFGINIHNYLKGPFFRDHDFVEIRNSVTGECFYTDPTIHDYLNITFISHK